jgi:hypothetical protein
MMSREIHAVETLVSPEDTQWAIAGKVPLSALEACIPELEEWLQGDGSKVVSGSDGFAALLVFGGPPAGESFAIELSRKYKTPVYLLDFYDELDDGLWITEYRGERAKGKPGYPAAFLATHGIIAPGYEPRPPPPIKAIGVVDDVTVEQARKALPEGRELFTANARGVLVDDRTGMVAISVALKLKRRCFTVFYNWEEETFSCTVYEPGKPDSCFSLGMSNANYEPLDSILGESTIDGVLRVLDIPRHLLTLAESATQPLRRK